jgi:hypothetical protein
MGHPLSFVSLCIENTSVFLRVFWHFIKHHTKMSAFEYFSQRRVQEQLPLIINGDDAAVRIGNYNVIDDRDHEDKRSRRIFINFEEFVYKHRKYSADLGFNLSLGKNFFSDHYLMVNNVMRNMVLKSNQLIGTEIRYLRTALAIGHRLKSEPTVTQDTLDAIEQKLKMDRHPEASKALIREFRFMNKGLLDRFRIEGLTLSFQPNYFLPKCLGGLGLENVTGEPFSITKIQLSLASYLIDHPEEQFSISYVINKPEVPESAALALRMVRRSVLLVPTNLMGPENIGLSADDIQENLFRRFLNSTGHVKDVESERSAYGPRRATLRLKSPELIKNPRRLYPKSFVMDYRPRRYMVVGISQTSQTSSTVSGDWTRYRRDGRRTWQSDDEILNRTPEYTSEPYQLTPTVRHIRDFTPREILGYLLNNDFSSTVPKMKCN